MISYFHQNKGSLTTCEDSLTATVFDLLKHLPINLFWKIIKDSIYQDNLPAICGEFNSIMFWNKWNAKNTYNTKYVEPDVFMRFQDFDLIFEAKSTDENQQGRHQMENQIQAYFNEFELDNKQVYFIQLGGLHTKESEIHKAKNNTKIHILKTDWSKLLYVTSSMLQTYKNSTRTDEKAYCRILNDVIHGFELHGFYKKQWLSNVHRYTPIQLKVPSNLFSYANK